MTCVLYLVPFILRVAGIVIPVWNFILFILWIAVFGVFGSVSVPQIKWPTELTFPLPP